MTTTRRRRIAPQALLLLPPLLLLPLPPLQASMPAPPLLTLIKQWQQWRQHGVADCTLAAAADSRMPSLTPAFFVFLTKCLLHVAQNTMFHGSFPPDFRPDSGFWILALE
jgi:hypothetical protein